MASPSPPQTHKKNQDKSGRMGGLMHLFDFNHALAGRKTPPADKKSGGGVEAPRNSLDVGGSILETPRSSTGRSDEGRYVWDSRETLSSRKPPVKAKAAQDMSNDQQVKNRAPSVVARLMGLDALPTASKISAIGLDALPTGSTIPQKPTGANAVEKSVVSKVAPDSRPRPDEKLPQNVKLYARKARAPLAFDANGKGHNAQESDWESDRIGPEPLSFRNHPQEHQLQEFKKEFAAWQSRKVRGDHPKVRSSKAIDLDVQLGTKHTLAREKFSEPKPTLAQDKMPSPKSNVQLDRLHETREFLDAMDFLQSNKEFFMKFLQEPNSIFARHVLDSEVSSQTVRHRRKYQTPDSTEEYKPQFQGREPIDLRRSSRNRHDYSQGDTVLERNMMNGSSFSSEDSLRVHDQQVRAFSSMTSQGRVPSDSRMPTRIVVLKPSPGKPQSQKIFSPSYPRPPKEHEEFVSEESKAVIERLREKLRKDMTKNYKKERRSMGLNVNEHYKDNVRDPREIAREIARQIRENVSKDLGRLHNVSLGNNETSAGRRIQSTRQAGQADNTADSVNQRPWATSRFEQEHHTSFALALRKKEEKKNSDWSIALSDGGQSGDSLSRGQIAPIKHRKDYEDNLVASMKPRSLRSSGRHSVDGSSMIHQNFVDSDISRLDSSIELEGDYAVRSGEESSDKSPRTLLRVRSVPAALNGERALPSEHAEAVPETKTTIPEVDASKLVDPSTRSTLSRKVAGLKGSFSFSKKKTQSNKEMDQSSPGKEEAFASDSVKEVISLKECEQNGLQDYESVPFTDLTLENSTSPEFAVDASKDLSDVEIEHLGTVSQAHEVTSLEESLILTDDQESISDSEGQPFEESSSTKDCDNSHQLSVCASDDAIPSSDVQLLKENPEQPSPISVLDAPFEDETVISAEFKEIKSDLQELRKRLDLLKFEDHDQDSEQETLPEASSFIKPNTCEGYNDATNVIDDNLSSIPSNELKPSFPCMDKLGYPDCNESQVFTYVKDVLAVTGYTGLDSGILPQPFSLGQLLDPDLFQQMESMHCNTVSEVDTESCKQIEKPFDLPMRHLLFDCVGEVLQEVLGSDDNLSLFLRPVRPLVLPKFSGNELVKHVSEKVQTLADSQLEVQDTLENLVTKDLAKGCQWFDFSEDKEVVALEIEKGILDDLIEETLLVL